MRWLLALWLAVAPACAQEAVIGSGVYGGTGTAAFQGPGDIVSGASIWVSCARAYNASYATPGTNKACDLRRDSDNATCTITIATNGKAALTPCGGSSVSSFCGGTTCHVTTAYDQSGNGKNETQATAANQPVLIIASLCMSFNGSTHVLNAALSAISYPLTFLGVITPQGAGSSANGVFANHLDTGTNNFTGNYMEWGSTSHNLTVETANANSFATGATGPTTITAGTSAVVSGLYTSSASRTAYINGSAGTADTSAENPTTQNNFALGAAVRSGTVDNYYNGYVCEFGQWPSGFTSGNESSQSSNARTFYGF